MAEIRKKTIAGLKAGETFSIARTFTKKDGLAFADITRDYNPVHFDRRFAAAKKFKGPICHGLMVASMLSEIGGQIGWLASEMSFQFKKPVYIGETITCEFLITDLDHRGWAVARVIYKNGGGEVVLEGILKGILPGAEEKEVMRAMINEGDPTNKIGK